LYLEHYDEWLNPPEDDTDDNIDDDDDDDDDTDDTEDDIDDDVIDLEDCSTADCSDPECVGADCIGPGGGLIDGEESGADSLNDLIYGLIGEESTDNAGSFYEWLNENLYGGEDWDYGQWNSAFMNGSYQGISVGMNDVEGMVAQFQSDIANGIWVPGENGGLGEEYGQGPNCSGGDCYSIFCVGSDCYFNQPDTYTPHGQFTEFWGQQQWEEQHIQYWETIMDNVATGNLDWTDIPGLNMPSDWNPLSGYDTDDGWGGMDQELDQFMDYNTNFSNIWSNMTGQEQAGLIYMYTAWTNLPDTPGHQDQNFSLAYMQQFLNAQFSTHWSPETPWGGGNSIIEAFDDNNDGWGFGDGYGEQGNESWESIEGWDWDQYGEWDSPGNETPWTDDEDYDSYEFSIDIGNQFEGYDPELENIGGYNDGQIIYQYGEDGINFGMWNDDYNGIIWDGDGQVSNPNNPQEFFNVDGMGAGIWDSYDNGYFDAGEGDGSFQEMMDGYYDTGLPPGFQGPPLPPDWDWGS
jgi:hypothetical protein